jgi:hypothetical protein
MFAGEHERFRPLVWPAMRRYADRHGYQAQVVDQSLVRECLALGLTPHWAKLAALLQLQPSEALWIDADCLLLGDPPDLREWWRAATTHMFANPYRDRAQLVSCIWAVRGPYLEFIQEAWEFRCDGGQPFPGSYEQGALRDVGARRPHDWCLLPEHYYREHVRHAHRFLGSIDDRVKYLQKQQETWTWLQS